MSAVLKHRISLREYFAIERAAPFRSQYFDGEMFAMAGASSPHNFIKENLVIELGGQLKGTRCRTLSSDQRLKVERTKLVTYPDIMIVCGQVTVSAEDEDTINNPVAIIEILSASTEEYDRGAKVLNYQQIDSMREYVLVAQDTARCERFVRQPDGNWDTTVFAGLQAILTLTSVEALVSLVDIYRGIEVM